MKNIKLYEGLSDWTKELMGLNNYYLIAFRPITFLSQQPKGFFSLIGIVNKQLKDKGLNYIYIGNVDNEYYYSFSKEITSTDIIKALKTEDPDPSKRLGTEVWRAYIHPFDEFSGGNDDYSVNQIGKGETVDLKIYDDPNWKLVGSNEQEGILEALKELSDWTKELLNIRSYYLISLNKGVSSKKSIFGLELGEFMKEFVKNEFNRKGILFDVLSERSQGIFIQTFDYKITPVEIVRKFHRKDLLKEEPAEVWQIGIYKLNYYNKINGDYDLTNNRNAQSFYINCGVYEDGNMILYRYPPNIGSTKIIS